MDLRSHSIELHSPDDSPVTTAQLDPSTLLAPSVGIDGAQNAKSLHQGRTTVAGAVFNLVCGCVGSGILGLPKALAHTGWSGVILICVATGFVNIASKWLIECLHLVPGRRLKSYEEVGEACFGQRGRTLVGIFQHVTLFGVCTITLVLLGGSMEALSKELTVRAWILIFTTVLLPLAFLKTMSDVAFLASFGVFSSIIVSFIIIIKGLMAYDAHGDSNYDPIAAKLFLGFSIIIFSAGYPAVLPALEFEMIEPEKWPLAVNISTAIITVLYLFIAITGYLGWGNQVKDNVLDSMSQGNGAVKLAYALIVARLLVAYPLPLNPMCLALENFTGINKLSSRLELMLRLPLRSLLVLSTVLIALIIPYFGDLMGLLGSLAAGVLAFIFPPVFYYTLSKRVNQPVSTPKLILMGSVCCVGIIASVVGTVYSLIDLIDHLGQGGNPFDKF